MVIGNLLRKVFHCIENIILIKLDIPIINGWSKSPDLLLN